MVKFKIEKGISPPKRGPKAKIADYQALVQLLPQMEAGNSIKVAEVPETARNSTYISVSGALKKAFDELGGGFRVSTAKLTNGKCEVRIWREEVVTKKKK